jgi:hypothetical protein
LENKGEDVDMAELDVIKVIPSELAKAAYDDAASPSSDELPNVSSAGSIFDGLLTLPHQHA